MKKIIISVFVLSLLASCEQDSLVMTQKPYITTSGVMVTQKNRTEELVNIAKFMIARFPGDTLCLYLGNERTEQIENETLPDMQYVYAIEKMHSANSSLFNDIPCYIDFVNVREMYQYK